MEYELPTYEEMFIANKLELEKPNEYIMMNRLYLAVEGEGTSIGDPKWFFRTQGCSVGCAWCDSKPTWRFDKELSDWRDDMHSMFKIEEQDFDEFAQFLADASPIRCMSITGGEPLQQNRELLRKLIDALHNRGFRLQVETSGQIYDAEAEGLFSDIVDYGGMISVDLKTPSSKVKANIEAITKMIQSPWAIAKQGALQLKAVNEISDEIDYEFIKKWYNHFEGIAPNTMNFIITPCWSPGKDVNLTGEWIGNFLVDNEWVSHPKVIMQQHKVIYGTEHQDS